MSPKPRRRRGSGCEIRDIGDAKAHDQRAEGIAELPLEAHTAGRPETTGRMLSVVAGARSDRLHTEGIPLAVRIQFSS
jgi:hypothetical protein